MDDSDDWTCYHEGAGNSNYLTLNSNADSTDGTMFNDTTPTSTVFTLGAASGSDYHNRANRSGYDYISYLWHDVPGLQKFGKYVGNGNADGSYIELGFRPSLVIIKNLVGQNWVLHDSVREPFNPVSRQILVSTDAAENDFSGNAKDLLSNGFKLRGTNSGTNDSDGANTYVYAAWAEQAAFNLFGGQSNAR